MQEEIWKDIEGYEGLYQISTVGRVKRVARYYTQYNGLTGKENTHFLPEMIMKPFEDEDGYLRIQFIKNGHRKKHFVHRLVALNFISNPDDKPEVNHVYGDKKDNRVENLEWVTSSENQRHALANNLYQSARGEDSGVSKLKEVQVREIHSLYSTGNYTQEKLSDMFGVRSNTISRILSGVRWKHVYKDLYGD